jgi:enamine deaminase RidA (YjgF/YER057c/UK114 family)
MGAIGDLCRLRVSFKLGKIPLDHRTHYGTHPLRQRQNNSSERHDDDNQERRRAPDGNENGQASDILYKGDVAGQCKYAFDKIKRALDKNGAGLSDIVKMVTYLTDMRSSADFGKCRQDTFGTIPMPAHTLLNVSQLAWPGMLIEIDVTAMVPLK